MNKKINEKKGAVRFFCICLAVLIVSSFFIWGFQSRWGDVTIKRMSITADNGTDLSTLVYLPENATNETPAPVVMMFHGRSNQGHSNDTWSMELARRGYVVFSPDLSGGGESTVTDREAQAVALTRFVTTLGFVQTDNIICVGYSAGCRTCNNVATALPDNVSTIVACLGPNLTSPVEGFDFNIGVIKAVDDQYNWDFIGDVQTCADAITERFALPEPVVPGKDYNLNGKLFRYMVIDDTLHQTGNISNDTIKSLVTYVTDVVPAPNPIPATNLVWLWQQLFSAVACVTMMFLLAASVNLLMQLDFFASAANTVPVKEARHGKKTWALDFLFSLVIPALIFVHVSAYAIKWTSGTWVEKIWTSSNLNGIMAWLLVIAVIGAVRMIVAAQKRKKLGLEASLGTYALGADGEKKIDWSKPGKALLMGIIVLGFVGVWLWLIEGFTGINYQVWNLSTYLRFSPMRITRAIPYMVIIFIVMFVGNMNQRILPSTGNEKRDMRRAVAVNTVMTASALFVLLVFQYGGSLIAGNGFAPIPQIDIYGTGLNKSSGSLDFAFGYCYMMGGTTGVVTYLYRKYGNIWVGVIPAAIFAGMVTLAGFTIVF